MITRWRIEAESPDKEEVENQIDDATFVWMKSYKTYIDNTVEWECTDEHGPEPINRDGEAVFYMRRVFKVHDASEGPRSGG